MYIGLTTTDEKEILSCKIKIQSNYMQNCTNQQLSFTFCFQYQYHSQRMVKNATPVATVTNCSPTEVILQDMREYILERNRTVVRYVEKCMETKQVCPDTRQSILERNLTVVRFVENCLQRNNI